MYNQQIKITTPLVAVCCEGDAVPQQKEVVIMVSNLSSEQGFFATAHKLRSMPSTADNLTELVDLTLESISKCELSEARICLTTLKKLIGGSVKHILDKYPGEIHNNVVEVTMLQRENCELRLELARLRKDDESISKYEELLEGFDEFFAHAIADLDPEHG